MFICESLVVSEYMKLTWALGWLLGAGLLKKKKKKCESSGQLLTPGYGMEG